MSLAHHLPSSSLSYPASIDQEAYQACRQWTIAVFQHITENDFVVRIVGGSTQTLGDALFNVSYDDDNSGTVWRRLVTLENGGQSRHLALDNATYHPETNAGADAFFSTVAIPAFYSALPSTVGLMDDNYDVVDEVCRKLCLSWGWLQ